MLGKKCVRLGNLKKHIHRKVPGALNAVALGALGAALSQGLEEGELEDNTIQLLVQLGYG
jgi:hypothetical protein